MLRFGHGANVNIDACRLTTSAAYYDAEVAATPNFEPWNRLKKAVAVSSILSQPHWALRMMNMRLRPETIIGSALYYGVDWG